MKKWGCLVGLALIVISLVWLWNSEWLQIDKCLDSGGRWDEPKQECQYQ